jgi:heterotetrameric sarcosine oxidase gamma subunit
MPERPRIRSALTGTGPLVSPVLHLEQLSDSRIVHLEGARPGQALDTFIAPFGARSLPEAGRFVSSANGVLIPVGPAIWLCLGPWPDPTAFALSLDVSGAWTQLVIAGSEAARVLAKGCALDLHPARFPPGACAAAGFARLRTIIWRPEQDRFHMLVGRSYARALWEWLEDAAAQFEVVPE